MKIANTDDKKKLKRLQKKLDKLRVEIMQFYWHGDIYYDLPPSTFYPKEEWIKEGVNPEDFLD